MKKKSTQNQKAILVPVSKINFNNRQTDRDFEKAKQREMEIAKASQIDKSKLSICISI